MKWSLSMKNKWGVLYLLIFLVSCGRKYDVTTPQYKDLSEFVFASGNLQADGQYNLMAETDGYLTKMNFQEGDVVMAGQLMAQIDNQQNVDNAQGSDKLLHIAQTNATVSAPAVQQIQANITAAKAQLKLDQQNAERYNRLLQSNSVSQLEYQNAQLAVTNTQQNIQALEKQIQNQLVNARQQVVTQDISKNVSHIVARQNQLRAVQSGRVYQKLKQPGDYVRKGDVIAVIGNPGLIYAYLNVDESNMNKVKVGEPVYVQLNTNKDKSYKAIVHEILPSFDVNSQSFSVKAYFEDSLDFKVVNTQLEANILAGEKKHALVIPRSYLGYGNAVLLKKDKKSITIQTGIVSNDWVEVVSGIAPKDEIISYKE